MKTLLTLFTIALLSCSSTVKKEEVPLERIKTHPAPQRRFDRAIASVRPIIVAVIDTGFGFQGRGKDAKLCNQGHLNLTNDPRVAAGYGTSTPVPLDVHGHGTNIVGIIDRNANWSTREYCVVVIKYFDPLDDSNKNLIATVKAIKYATNIGADYINYSGGGETKSSEEIAAVRAYLDRGGKFIAAAGNEGKDLEKTPYYPAMDDSRTIIVGNLDTNAQPIKSSNYGTPVDIWELGTSVSGFGLMMTGTSQAAAVVTGKMIKQQIERQK